MASQTHHNQRFILAMILIMGVFLLLPTVSAWTSTDFIKDDANILEKETTTNYGTYEITSHSWWDILKIWTEKKVKRVELVDNTDFCGDNCYAIKDIELFEKGSLIDDVRFYRIYEDDSRVLSSIRSYEVLIKTGEEKVKEDIYEYQCVKTGKIVNGSVQEEVCEYVKTGTKEVINDVWEEYILGSILDIGNYTIKLLGEKRADWAYDWQVKFNDVWSEEWAVWGGSDVILLFNTTIYSEASGTKVLESTFNFNNISLIRNISFYASAGVGYEPAQVTYEWVFQNGTSYNFTVGSLPSSPTLYTHNNLYRNENVNLIRLWMNGWSGTPSTSRNLTVYGINGSYITLNSPADNYISQNPEVNFNCSATVVGGATSTNMSLWFDGSINETQTKTGTTNTSIFTKTLIDGTYNWTCQACDSDGDCGFASENRTIDIDTTAPLINIIYPTSPIEYGYIGKNVSLNFSASDTNLDKCWYNYNGTNTIINCNVNSTFILTTQQNITLYANDSMGNVASLFRSWDYTYFETNQTYSAISYETSTENFYLNLNYNSSAYGVTAILNYDGTNYTSINTGAGDNGIFKATITIPLITTSANKTFFWYVNGIRNINYNQTVSPIILQLCNATYNVSALNFTYYNEANLLPINATANNTIIKATFGYWIGDGSIKKEYSYQNLTPTSNSFVFCINPPSTNMTTDLTLEYGATDFLDNNYELENSIISNVTRNITLYLLPLSLGTKFTHTLRRGIDFIPNKLVSIDKYFVGIGQWKNIGIRKTDNTGRFVAYLELDKNYNYTVQNDNGSIIASIENTAICLTAPCEITLQIDTTSSTVFSEMEAYIAQNVIYSLTYNKTIKMVNLNFTDLTGTANYWRMWVYKPYFGNETMDTICNITSFTSIGVMECNTTGYYGDIVARVYISRSPEIIVDFLTFLNEDRTEALGTSGLLASILILLVIILTASRSASGALIMIPFGLVILKFLGFLPLSWGVVVGVVIFITIIAMKMRT